MSYPSKNKGHESSPVATASRIESQVTNDDDEQGEDSNKKVFRIINRKYVKSFTGVLHLISSLAALLIGNFAFLQVIVRGIDITSNDLKVLFYSSTALSGGTLFLFYDKVQSWQLSTTSMEDKGLTAKQMQNFNRGRGIFAMVLCAIYPLTYHLLPPAILRHPVISKIISLVVLCMTYFQYTLIRDYGKLLFMVYGASKMSFSIQIFLSGSLDGVRVQFPYAVTFLEKEAYLVVSCVEFGFLWYYLYSRRLVRSKEIIQTACKNYHPTLLYIWIVRITVGDRWWSGNKLPWLTLSWIMVFYTFYTSLFLYKILKSTIYDLVTSTAKSRGIKDEKEREGHRSQHHRRRSSIFEIHDTKRRRRSSVFEQIDVGIFHEKDD